MTNTTARRDFTAEYTAVPTTVMDIAADALPVAVPAVTRKRDLNVTQDVLAALHATGWVQDPRVVDELEAELAELRAVAYRLTRGVRRQRQHGPVVVSPVVVKALHDLADLVGEPLDVTQRPEVPCP